MPAFAYPSLVREQTLIAYELTGGTEVSGCIYDAAGNLVERLVSAYQVPGRHEVTWDASNVTAGVYFFNLIAGDRSSSLRLIKVN